MAVTYGFYNSVNGDRTYDAIQHGSIFDGIIQDGVFMSFGNRFFVTPGTGMVVNVDLGRGWFKHTWILNDAVLPINIDQSEIVLKRIDRIVIDVNAIQSVRANSIQYIKGTPSANPVAPALVNETDHRQYPICNIAINAGVTSISQANITFLVGTTACPFVTGILQGMNIENLIAQWEQQWTDFYDEETGEMTATKQQWQTLWNSWYTTETTADAEQWDSWYTNETTTNETEMETWKYQRQAAFDAWFANLQTNLDSDTAGHLQNEINDSNGLLANQFRRDTSSGLVIAPYGIIRDYKNMLTPTYIPESTSISIDSGAVVINGETINVFNSPTLLVTTELSGTGPLSRTDSVFYDIIDNNFTLSTGDVSNTTTAVQPGRLASRQMRICDFKQIIDADGALTQSIVPFYNTVATPRLNMTTDLARRIIGTLMGGTGGAFSANQYAWDCILIQQSGSAAFGRTLPSLVTTPEERTNSYWVGYAKSSGKLVVQPLPVDVKHGGTGTNFGLFYTNFSFGDNKVVGFAGSAPQAGAGRKQRAFPSLKQHMLTVQVEFNAYRGWRNASLPGNYGVPYTTNVVYDPLFNRVFGCIVTEHFALEPSGHYQPYFPHASSFIYCPHGASHNFIVQHHLGGGYPIDESLLHCVLGPGQNGYLHGFVRGQWLNDYTTSDPFPVGTVLSMQFSYELDHYEALNAYYLAYPNDEIPTPL